ncbi:MAG TPA: CHAP domain-containing protein, partial [Propionibacteriaceae bacterium]|nr:CHAP domain-containing protein [Propionibacteriaceae bacterium]
AAAARAEAARQQAASRSASRPAISTYVPPAPTYTPVSNGTSWTPSSYYSVPNYGGVDPWGFYWGECVSYAAFKVRTSTAWTDFINNYTDRGTSVHFGNAVEWGAAAQALGIPVNTTPTVGSIAWRTSGAAGHVAYVTAVHPNGTIDVAEYNMLVYHGFDVRTNIAWWTGGTYGFAGFIHFEQSRP